MKAIGELVQEFRYALRQFRRSRGLFLAAVLLMTMGIGASTLIFTIVDALLLRPLPVRNPGSLVELLERYPNIRPQSHLSYQLYEEISRQSSTVSDVVGYLDLTTPLERETNAERAYVQLVTDNFLSGLGVGTALGRVSESTDDHVAVLSFEGWTRYFRQDRAVIGQTVRLGGHSFQIAGVTREGFNGIDVDTTPDVFISYRHLPDFRNDSTNDRNLSYLTIVARMRPGITMEQARQEIEPAWQRSRIPFANPNSEMERHVRFELQSARSGSSSVREQFRTPLLLLFAGTALLVLMVCANVGSLLIARAAAQEKEMAVRMALGASRTRILRQWLIESLLLTVAGGIGGVLLTYAAIPLLVRWMPAVPGAGVPGELRALSLHIQPDWWVLGFFAVSCGLAAILSAVAPAWRSRRYDLLMALKASISEKRHRRLQTVLCALQVSLCTVLLISAALTWRTLSNLRTTDAGFDREHVLSFSIDPGMRHYDSESAWSLRQRLLDGARAIPGVRAAGIGGMPLMRGIGLVTAVRLPGQQPSGGFNTSVNVATPGYFDAMGMHFLSGHDFSEAESDRMPAPIIVNEAFAHRFFGNDDVLGRYVGVTKDNLPQYEIVGLVGDAHYRSLRESPPPVFYMRFARMTAANSFILQVRTSGPPESMIRPIRDLLKSIDSSLPIYQVATLAEEIDRSLWQERLTVGLAGSFALFAMLLSSIGLHGMLTYFVVQHRRELGVRMAIGASASDVVRLVSMRVSVSLISGLLAGALLFMWGGRWMQTVLYGVRIFDPISMAATLLLVFATAGAAIVIPSVRAIRIDPASSLREN